MAIEQQRQKRRRHGLANYRLIRYADDFVVLVTGEQEHAQALRDEVAAVLAPMGLRLSPEKTRVVHIDDGFDFLGFNIRRMRKRGSQQAVRLHPSLGQGDRLDQGPGQDHDLQTHPAPRPGLPDGVPGSGAAWLGELLPTRCLQSSLQRGRLLRVGADHVLAAEEAPHRLARAPAQVLPARHLAPGPRRATVPWRRHRHGHPVPLPRLPHPDPVDPINHTASRGSSLPWRARCGESRTAGSAGGPGKRSGSNAATAPRADPTGGRRGSGSTGPSPSWSI